MAYYLIVRKDKKGKLEKRKSLRDQHLQYINNTTYAKLVLAGPILNNDEQMCGSSVVIECENREQAQIFADNDPYHTQADLFESTLIEKWNLLINNLSSN